MWCSMLPRACCSNVNTRSRFEESERQRKEYAACAARFPGVAVVDAARPLADVVQEVVDRIVEFQLTRLQRTLRVRVMVTSEIANHIFDQLRGGQCADETR